MKYIKIEVKAEEIAVGDVFVLVKGYSGNMKTGQRVEQEVIQVEIQEKLLKVRGETVPTNVVVMKLRDRKTGKKSSNWDYIGRENTVYPPVQD